MHLFLAPAPDRRMGEAHINFQRKIYDMRIWIPALLVATLLTGMSFAQTAEKPLYDRLGGKPAIEAVASGLVDRILADGRVNKWFTHASSSPENTKAYK